MWRLNIKSETRHTIIVFSVVVSIYSSGSGQCKQGWSLWNGHPGTLHLNTARKTGAWERVLRRGSFQERKGFYPLPSVGRTQCRSPTRRGSDREGDYAFLHRILAGEVYAICPGRPMSGGTLPELLLPLSVLWPLSGFLIELVFREKSLGQKAEQAKRKCVWSHVLTLTEHTRDRE